MPHRLALYLLLAATLVGCVASPTRQVTSSKGASGFISERLDRIDDAINAEIAAGKIPGAVAVIIRDGVTVYSKSFGYADMEANTPLREDSIFRIASMTKAITTVGVMILYERGHFRLNDPISSHLPGFAEPQVLVSTADDGTVTEIRPAKGEVRIIDLLTHASGIGYPFIPTTLQRAYRGQGVIDGVTAKDVRLGEVMDTLADMPLLFDPGERMEYGLSTDLLGYLIEVVADKPLDAFFEEEIFAPLAMPDTHFYLPVDKADRLTKLYADVDGLIPARGDESSFFVDNPNYPVEGAKAYFSGGAGLSSTAGDYARFLQMLLHDGELDGVRLLGRKSVELMRTPRLDWDDDGQPDFSLGFQVVSDVGKYGELGSNGMYRWGGAFGTSYFVDPTERLVAVFMSQVRPTTSDIRNRFSDLVYQALR